MINSSFEIYKTVRESEMDAAWCNNCVSWLRRDSRSIVNKANNIINKSYLFSRQDMSRTASLFKKDSDFWKLRNGYFPPLPIMENIINLHVEEITKNPPRAELTATDPSASLDKQSDLELFKTKGIHERNINSINKKIGEPAYRVSKDKFKGSMEGLDNMDLDPSDPDDQNFFYQNNRMKYEIAGQSLVNNIMKLGRFDEDSIQDFVVDILADKVICMDIYVDKITGEIKHDYIYPETFYGLFGKKADGSDDICKYYEKSMTINEALQIMGNKFIWDRDWRNLLWAINYKANNTFTGFLVNNVKHECIGNPNWMNEAGINQSVTKSNLFDWTLAYTYEIYLGKIQYKVPQVTSNYKYKKSDQFEEVASMPNDWQITEQEEVEGYQQESFYQEQTYEAYYIATSSVSQWIYGWGKVYHQLLHGANDEYSDYTLHYYRKRGLPAVELCKTYIDLANDAYYKMVWAVYEAHPDYEVYLFEELTQLAKVMYSQAANTNGKADKNVIQSQLTGIIKYFKNNLVKLKTIPRVDGKPQINLNNTPGTEKRGLDPISIAMQAVTIWAETQIMSKLGINDLRQGNIENEREGFKQGQLETQFSMNVTGYVYRMIQYMKTRVATTDLLLAQDIIKFKDSIPYKWIKKIVGDENFENLKVIEDFAAHRFGIMVQDVNIAVEKKRINDAADMALDKGDGRGGLAYDEWFMVTQTTDYKQAVKLLSYLKLKLEKKKRKQQLEDAKTAQANIMEQKKADAQLEKDKGAIIIEKANIDADASKYVANKNAESKIEVKKLTTESEAPKQDAKAAGNKQVLQEKANLESQRALPA